MTRQRHRIVPSFLSLALVASVGAGCEPGQVGGESIGSNNEKPSFEEHEFDFVQPGDARFHLPDLLRLLLRRFHAGAAADLVDRAVHFRTVQAS